MTRIINKIAANNNNNNNKYISTRLINYRSEFADQFALDKISAFIMLIHIM